ncbi:MAG: zinc ribbon domain-containing protein, partial [Clostridia bacterium]|nr:zinc ribbon domain-containing protein [Clostridia bacterium]
IYSLGIVLYKLLNNNRDPFLPAYPAPVKYNDKTEAMVKRIQGLPLPKPVNADEKLARIVFKTCAHDPLERYAHPKDLRLELESIALRYADLQSEVFSENGINYYTNKSIFETDSKSANTSNSVVLKVAEDIVVTAQEEANTLLTVDEEDTVLLGEEKSVTNEPKKVEPVKETKTTTPPVAQPVNNVVCPVCKRIMKPGVAFCGSCGQRLAAPSVRFIFCSKCGNKMKFGVKFCGKCGKKM